MALNGMVQGGRLAGICSLSGPAFLVAFLAMAGVLYQSQHAFGQYQSRLTLQGEGQNAGLTRHRDALNRPCLDFEAASRAGVVNPNLFEHVVSIYNGCLKTIEVKVCYYGSDHCVDMTVPGLKRRDGILGIFPGIRYFRYSFREKF